MHVYHTRGHSFYKDERKIARGRWWLRCRKIILALTSGVQSLPIDTHTRARGHTNKSTNNSMTHQLWRCRSSVCRRLIPVSCTHRVWLNSGSESLTKSNNVGGQELVFKCTLLQLNLKEHLCWASFFSHINSFFRPFLTEHIRIL